jgi:hypothetical protein
VRDFLEPFRGKRIYHAPLVDDKGVLVGNNGDRLMVLGTDLLYKDLEIQRIDSADEADLIIIGGNGGMLEKFTHIPRLFRTCCREYPDTPLCVLPSTGDRKISVSEVSLRSCLMRSIEVCTSMSSSFWTRC